VLPVFLTIIVVRRGRATRADFASLLFLSAFWGVDGAIIDGFYRLQAVVFGAHADFRTVAMKVLVDQLLYNPLFAAPNTMACFEFRKQGYHPGRMRHVFTAEFYRVQVVPALCATWAVWIPVTTAIYALPSLLQIPLFALALSFWSLLITYITSRPQTQERSPARLEHVARE
jgi:hypothetical protein